MSADKKGPFGKSKLSEILDFGPDSPIATPVNPANETGSFTDRLKQIVKNLQELNERIEIIANRF